MSKTNTIIVQGRYVATQPGALLADAAVVVEKEKITFVGPVSECRAKWPDAEIYDFPDAIITAGLVNAHQHGRGLSQIQLGYQDDYLESWIAGRRGRGRLDSEKITRLAAARMLANGVTTTIHANYSYGTGDYEQELRAQIAAYLSTGLRSTVCVGAMDRGALVYPPHESCFMAGLTSELRDWLSRPGNLAYCKDAASTVELMHRLRADFAGEPLVRMCYGPAGPQWVTDDTFRVLAKDAARHGIGLHLHALESPAQRDAARELFPEGVFQHLEKLGVLNERCVVAHGVWVDEKGIEVLARTGATVVRNPGCNLRMRNGIAPLARYLRAGIRVAIGTDNCSMQDDEDLLSELRLAGGLGREADWHGARPPSAQDLLQMATVNGAVAAQFGAECGILEPGRLADIAVFSLGRTTQPYLDPDMPILDAFMARGQGSDALLTMVGGEVHYLNGEYTKIDIDKIEADAASIALAARGPDTPADIDLTKELRQSLCNHYRHVSIGKTTE